ncbi:related to amidohydrolase AmhX [Phialocephala subalpina]|uniref:Peptidase M20 domain-containing protein 2 n=1 Tax=Phialocephala subalpina TaxID=576137 RepID=A0A1L7XRB0_9HELO|nr:related to amidohydrolase AmhX [Phialocephala subalpina]
MKQIDPENEGCGGALEQSFQVIYDAIESKSLELRDINRKIFDNPELGYAEFKAHDNIVVFLQSMGFAVTPHAYGLATSFRAEFGSGGRVVAFNAEYDALPEIGHACGHNLIATASIAAFIGLAAMLRGTNLPGRVRLIGTPAEEGGGGKLLLIDAGAYKDVDACLMVHPTPPWPQVPAGTIQTTGSAYGTTNANVKFNVSFIGKPAHAAVAPYEGVNALDAVVLSYNAVSMLRQQTRPSDRIHSVILEGGQRPNVITASTKSQYYVRSASLKSARALKERVKNCLDGAALATGCKVEYELINEYADVRCNKTLSRLYTTAMANLSSPVDCDFDNPTVIAGSTDQGNVSYACPSIHAMFGIRCPPGVANHTPGFTACAGTDESHDRAVITGKAMAVAAWNVLVDDEDASNVRKDFERDILLERWDPENFDWL